MTILIVEDDSFQSTLAERMLANLGVTNIVCAASRDAALDAIKTLDICGVLLDLVLENGSGIEIARACESAGVPVVFLTGTLDPHNVDLMFDLGWVIQKPASVSKLARAVDYFRRLAAYPGLPQ